MSAPPSPPRRAAFLDRDGVINAVVDRDGVRGSPRCLDEFCLLDGVSEAVGQLRGEGWLVFVVTNQPDVARGLLDRAQLELMTERVRAAIDPDEVAVCAHDDRDACGCRKPAAGMLLRLATDWNVDLSASVMIGDSWKDVEAARRAGCRAIFVGRSDDADAVRADAVAVSLAGAVALLTSRGVS